MQEEGKRRETEKEKKRQCEKESTDGEKRRRRSAEPVAEEPREKLGQPEVPQETSDLEEGGLDLNRSFKAISAYMQDRREMLEQCFHVLGENKLQKMLPDELKDCSFSEIKTLCWDQLQQLSDLHLLEILEGKELTGTAEPEDKRNSTDSQQDSIVDSTSSLKENPETDEKQGAGSEEDSDVLSINADIDDSDIEGHKDAKLEEAALREEAPPPTTAVQSAEPKLQLDIDRSVSEILALTSSDGNNDLMATSLETSDASEKADAGSGKQPSAQQLELLELEMRARAIKALMKASEINKRTDCGLH